MRTKVSGSESSTTNSLRGAKVPGSELARVLLELSLRGANWPGSEKAVNPHWHALQYLPYSPVYFSMTGEGLIQPFFTTHQLAMWRKCSSTNRCAKRRIRSVCLLRVQFPRVCRHRSTTHARDHQPKSCVQVAGDLSFLN